MNLGGSCAPLIVGTDLTRRVIVASFQPDGTCRWNKLFEATGGLHGNGIAVDDSGRVYLG